jgi:hypothetical protein
MTAPVFGFGPNTPTMSGPMILSRTAPMMDANIACSISSTSSPASAWRSGLAAGSNPLTSSTPWRICSSCAAFRPTSGPTMVRSSSLSPCANGSPMWARRPPTSSRAVHGRMAIARASTQSCAMNCSTERSSTRSTRPRSSLKAGETITTAHQNTHLAMLLKGIGFAGRDAIPRGILDFAAPAQ